MKISQVLTTLLVILTPAVCATAADLTQDDAAVIKHIKATDPIFVAALGKCSSEQLTRNGKEFTYSGTCAIKEATETDCYGYSVTASGTVDTDSWVTVRDIKLILLCSA